MLNFFRKIRRSSLGADSTTKYLLYAMGEITLVVVGILIALQINNWNERKKTKVREHQALQEIMSDLDASVTGLENILTTDENSLEKAINSLNIVLFSLNSSSAYHDSLSIHFRNVFYYPDVNLKSSGFESLTSMGMDLISDDHLRSEIGKYYSFTTPTVYKANQELRDDFYKYMIEHMQHHFVSTRNGNGIGNLVPADFSNLRDNRSFKQSLVMYLDVFQYYKQQVLNTSQAARELHALIDQEFDPPTSN